MSDLSTPEQAPAEVAPAIAPAPRVRYVGFTRRFRAFVIDIVCVWGLFLALFFLGEVLSGVPGISRVIWLSMVAVLLLYDPLLVSRQGATIGHVYAQLRVVDMRTGRWPSFGRAFVRSFVKLMLGGLSFFTMELSRRHQAVHDMLTKTTVQVAESAQQVEFRVERVDEPDVVLPSRLRRLVVIVLYLVAVLIAFSALTESPMCDCAGEPSTKLDAISLGWLALSVTVIIAGWRGRLWGARRSRRVSTDVAVA